MRHSSLLSLLLVLTLLLSLCACAAQKEDPAPADAAPLAEQEKDPHADDPRLVADAFRYTYMYMDKDETGADKTFEHTYAIPKLLLDSPDVTALNGEIYDTLYNADLIETVENDNENRGTLRPFYDSIGYEWAVHGDVLSLIIEVSTELEPLKCYVYNLSIERKGLISDAVVYKAARMSEQAYRENTEKAFAQTFFSAMSDIMPSASISSVSDLRPFADNLQATMSEDNLKLAKPYFNSDGTLCAYGFIYSPATDEQTPVQVDLEHIGLFPDWAQSILG